MSIFNGMMATDELQSFADILAHREKLLEEMRQVENWERPGEDVNIKNQSVKDLHAEAVTKTQQLDIQAIINDAMKKRDRYVSILVTNEGHMSVNVYPSEEEDYVEEEESRSKKVSVRRKKLYQYNYPF